jgi:AcrR family transcriptional regulator
MRYPPGRRDESRSKIVRSARRLFNRFGFDAVSIEQIMADAGLTHGGFYRHFAGKSDLYAEVLQCFFTDPGWEDGWDGIHVDLTAADIGPQIVRAYLSRQHLKEVDNACPMVALPSDVARAGESARRAYEAVFNSMVESLQRGSVNDDRPDRVSALAIAALCIGGMAIARASRDCALSDEVREAAMTVALEIGGWNGDTEPGSRAVATSST